VTASDDSPSPIEPSLAAAPGATAAPIALPTSVQPTPISPPSDAAALGRLALGALALLYLISVVRFGWASDDGFITARSIHNLLTGYGLAVNPGHRVQGYTSPLWMLLCLPLHAVTGNPYMGLLLAGLGCSTAFTIVVVRTFRDRPWAGAMVLAAAAASSAFLGFSTSGLENPLANLLLALFCRACWRPRPPQAIVGRESFLLAGLIFLTRFDYILLIAPTLLVEIVRARRTSQVSLRALLREALAFAIPVGAWLAFAMVYYGFPFPNTAYAKLNTSIPLRARLEQGLSYFVDAVYRDPVLVLFPAIAMYLILRTRASRQARALLAGVGLYLGYVAWIGGDFMGGRFLTAAFLVSLLVAAHESQRAGASDTAGVGEAGTQIMPAFFRWATAAAFLIGLANLADRRVDRGTECNIPLTGIVDERACYVEYTGLAVNLRQQKWRSHGYVTAFHKAVEALDGNVVVFDLVGMAPFGDPRPIHIVEHYALSEPLLARIRFSTTSDWRPGHLYRELPAGYLETLKTGRNTIADPCLHRLHDRLSIVTTGPLFSGARFATIAALSFGGSTCPAPER
jgi:arabinofuranosyltransferase